MGLKDVQYCSKMVENCFICYVFYPGGKQQYSTILEQQPITALYSGSCTIPVTIREQLFGSNIRVSAVRVGFNISYALFGICKPGRI